jgi:hypothetical protein
MRFKFADKSSKRCRHEERLQERLDLLLQHGLFFFLLWPVAPLPSLCALGHRPPDVRIRQSLGNWLGVRQDNAWLRRGQCLAVARRGRMRDNHRPGSHVPMATMRIIIGPYHKPKRSAFS